MRDVCICDTCGLMSKMEFGEYSSKLPENWKSIHSRICCPKCFKIYNKKCCKKIISIKNNYSNQGHRLNLEEKAEIDGVVEEWIKETEAQHKK